MEGLAERDHRAFEKIVLQAWWNANLDGAGDKLRQPSYYLEQLKPKKPQTGDEVLAVWQEHASRAPGLFKIKHIGPDGKELN